MDLVRILANGIREQVEDINGSDKLQDGVKAGINIAFTLIGIVAVIIIIIGAIHYMTSQGDPSKVTTGKKTIIGGVIGLIIVLLAFAIVNFVLNSL
jgi:uncharacterized membrane protein